MILYLSRKFTQLKMWQQNTILVCFSILFTLVGIEVCLRLLTISEFPAAPISVLNTTKGDRTIPAELIDLAEKRNNLITMPENWVKKEVDYLC